MNATVVRYLLLGFAAVVPKTVKPVAHRVDNTEPPTYCKLCRSKHGYGNKN